MSKGHTRRVKIVATMGPACSSRRSIDALLRAGLDMARVNYSHADPAFVPQLVRRLRAAAVRAKRPLALLADLPGPKLRIGELEGDALELRAAGRVTLLIGRKSARGAGPNAIPVPQRLIGEALNAGDMLFLDDGLIRLKVERIEGNRALCKVIDGGILRSRKGITLAGTLDVPTVGPRDRIAIRQAVELGFDYIAASFVRSAQDVEHVRRLTRRAGRELPIIAKLERPEAIDNLQSIVDCADCVMVARGDLGVSLPIHQVPVLQKQIISVANAAGKPCITATQMLESMTVSPLPTRAEVSDVANAILDGTDAVMLSAETASGKYPLRAVKTMDAVTRYVEQELPGQAITRREATSSAGGAVGDAACEAAQRSGARWIVAFTRSGASARLISSLRPTTPICALTPDAQVRNSLALCWGVTPLTIDNIGRIDDVAQAASAALRTAGLARKKDVLVLVYGRELGTTGSTDTLVIHKV
ncbi:MAG: pyruvate kinase [Candidatus Alcyoniella australis]|nr:pyruvate kinase [Candidatus Alcyoniella australis]